MKRWLFLLLIFLGISGWSHQTYNSRQELTWQSHRGDAVAQYRLANEYWRNDDRTAAHYWWQRSARQQYYPAIESLIHAFPKARNEWLELAVAAGNLPAQRQVAAAQLTNKEVSLNQWLNRWKDSEEPWLTRQVALLDRYQRKTDCEMSIKVIAADSGDKKRYLNFLAAVKSSPFSSDKWCVSWTLDKNLSCVTSTSRSRAECHSDKQFDKQVVLADKGIASADNDTLTLTPDSSERVIQHELGHWMGFADEYDMSEPLALRFCHGHYDHQSLNIIITEKGQGYSAKQVKEIYQRLPWRDKISSWQEIASRDGELWRLGSSEGADIGLFKADTCNTIRSKQAWRPVNVSTAMEQHDTGVWPALYLELYRERYLGQN